MGNIYEGIDNEIQKKFIDAHVLNKEKCCGCWARFLCAGGCLAQSYQENQDLNEPATQHCFVSRENLKWSMYVYSKLERDYPNVLSQLKRIGKIRDAMHTDKLFEEELETKIKLTDEI
jgi:sulfatase maturation enzyme AslB (radical SAM superfamily)